MEISIRFVTAVFTLVALTNVIHAGCPSQSRVSAHRSSGYQTAQPFLAQQPTYRAAVFQHSQPQPQPVAPRIEATTTMPVSTTSPPTAQTSKSPKKELLGSNEQKVTRHDVTVGEVVRLNHQLPAKSGIAVLKAGPIVLRVTLLEWTTGHVTLKVPDMELMKKADAELFLVTDQGKPLGKYAFTLLPVKK